MIPLIIFAVGKSFLFPGILHRINEEFITAEMMLRNLFQRKKHYHFKSGLTIKQVQALGLFEDYSKVVRRLFEDVTSMHE